MINFQVREGITLTDITPESVYGFEFFVYRSPENVKEMDAFIAEAKGKGCFLDVGAYGGIFSCVFQTLNHARCCAFEPSEIKYPDLVHNTKALGVNSYHIALSDQDTLKGHIEDGMFIAGSMEMLGIDPTTHNELISVPVIKGDDLQLEPDLMKIDVEGHEAAVLRGLKQTITRYRPTIFLETHHEYLDRVNGRKDLEKVLSELPEYDTEIIGPYHTILRFK